MKNLVATHKLPKDYFSKVFCVIILFYSPFKFSSGEKFMAAIFKSSLQNLSPLPPRLKSKSTDLANPWT